MLRAEVSEQLPHRKIDVVASEVEEAQLVALVACDKGGKRVQREISEEIILKIDFGEIWIAVIRQVLADELETDISY